MDLDDILKKAQESGEDWAVKSAAYHRHDKGFKTKFAEVKNIVRTTMSPPVGKGRWTSDDLDDATHIHPVWQQFMADMDKAYLEMIQARVKYDNYRNALDAARSQMATQREEMRYR